MIPCNGSHMLININRKYDVVDVFKCDLATANKLLDSALGDKSNHLAQDLLVNSIAIHDAITSGKKVCAIEDVQKALEEVLRQSGNPVHLGYLLSGSFKKALLPVVTKEMRNELVLFLFDDEKLKGIRDLSATQLEQALLTLSFLAPARKHLADCMFIHDDDIVLAQKLLDIRENKWKDSAKEERIIQNYYCALFDYFGNGEWLVKEFTTL